MTFAGVLTSLVIAVIAFIGGLEYGLRVGDNRAILGAVFALLVFATGLAWTFGW